MVTVSHLVTRREDLSAERREKKKNDEKYEKKKRKSSLTVMLSHPEMRGEKSTFFAGIHK
jgi:hypothetical protein